ncbi:hypothetical protein EHF44_17420 [Cupriavidus pauculus]|uniref:Uncharacterized protein n=1 Tax=Cupriavidus pauculus TaxID=82633 RepID=A0A3G8H3G4_9BURK|nr:hypothetical protein EHF44_17420 [Cupriavidus pauculus]
MILLGWCVAVVADIKKPPGSLAVSLALGVCLQPSLSIRQRCEMPKEVKVKLGGHGGKRSGCSELVSV